ncbi:CaiB/BaiF CoA transferase family protein [Oricola thermophila]|uniref:CoA transferase n=1 Tax=Oricola thermophila TaxID=2742145 RepID=A0A6N1VE13_9HYPH|nr:CoA transferase [Oricola thermophila]QKV19094.1 CoA transferase [Oricola thermophila]
MSGSVEELPLAGIRVLDFSQFLAGPVCALRLGDMGAEVIKVERPGVGDACRGLVVADQKVDGDSLLFHTINRGKQSVVADLKDDDDLAAVKRLVATADVMIHNFRPGVMERIGLGHEDVRELNPRLVYGQVSGYGKSGPWSGKPGQDLLAQSRSGMVWLTGSAADAPVPMGISITDIAAGMHLAQGILAALFRRFRTGRGGLVEVSLLASAMDLQFEQFTSYLNDGHVQPVRSAVSGANVYAAAPYGIYETLDGFIAIAMTPVARLAELLSLDRLLPLADPAVAYSRRDEIKAILRDHLKTGTTETWMNLLEPAGIWCAEVLDWPSLERSGALDALDILQRIETASGREIETTACPIRFDGRVPRNAAAAPVLGADTDRNLSALRAHEEIECA